MRILALASKSGERRASPSVISRLALRGALGMALLIGGQCAAFAHEAGPQEAVPQTRIQSQLRKGDTAQAVTLGEAAMARAPQDALLRAELGYAYLGAGRFESAAMALGDAVALGDTTNRTVLSLALAQIACGQNRAALATLDRGGDIAPAGLGLALALAGDPGRGIAVLTDAVRDGAGSANLRQNLAYAYALDGRWADATLTAGFDLSPDQVNARVQQWAQSMQSGGDRLRIAQLLNVPLIADAGMPAALALNETKPDPAPAPVAALVPAPAVVDVPPTPAVADTVAASPAIAAPLPQVAVVAAPAGLHRPAVRAHVARRNSGHFVQLASYHSRRSAALGRVVLAKRLALLRGHELKITQARFHGHRYWRVVMASFDGSSATNFCAILKRHGAACFAYSTRPRGPGQALANKSGSMLAAR